MKPDRTFYRLATKELPINVTYRVYWGKSSPAGNFTYVASNFSVLLVYAGRVQTSIDGKPLVLLPGDIRIFLKDDLHLFQSLEQGTKYVQISISPRLFQFPQEQFLCKRFVQPLKDGLLDCPRLLQPGDPGYDAIYAQMHRLDVNREGQDAYTAELFAIAISLCAALFPLCSTQRKEIDPTENAVRMCLKYMSTHGREKITLEQLAELVHLHPNYLCSVFKKYTGKTIFEHLTKQRLRRASRQLQGSQKPVQQIAEICGFPSISFFSRKFKAVYGCTPIQFRKKHANTYADFEEE